MCVLYSAILSASLVRGPTSREESGLANLKWGGEKPSAWAFRIVLQKKPQTLRNRDKLYLYFVTQDRKKPGQLHFMNSCLWSPEPDCGLFVFRPHCNFKLIGQVVWLGTAFHISFEKQGAGKNHLNTLMANFKITGSAHELQWFFLYSFKINIEMW